MSSLEDIGTAALAFVHEHRAWAGPVVFVFAFCESVAFLSLLVPATIILLGLGALIGENGLDLWTVWLAATAGAFFGDWLSYWFGRKFKHRVAEIWPLTRFPGLIPRGEQFFRTYGIPGLFVGRFFGPLRAALPLTAGICAMPLLRFQATNIASAFIWSGAMLAPGAVGAHFLSRIF
jgi:membrane protein DedA with SNARE-associated domain